MIEMTNAVDPQSSTVTATISDPNADASAGFGSSLSVSGAKVGVGLPGQANGAGMAQVYQNLAGGNWNNAGSVTNQNGNPDDGFGTAVSLSGDMMAVGSPGDDSAGMDAGAAFVFDIEGDNFVQIGGTITPSDPTAEANFGSSVSLIGNQLAVGAPQANGNASKSGAGYLFGLLAGGVWNQVAKTLAENGGSGDLFGSAVAYDGENFLIGAPNGTRQSIQSGFVSAFTNANKLFRDSFEQRIPTTQ